MEKPTDELQLPLDDPPNIAYYIGNEREDKMTYDELIEACQEDGALENLVENCAEAFEPGDELQAGVVEEVEERIKFLQAFIKRIKTGG